MAGGALLMFRAVYRRYGRTTADRRRGPDRHDVPWETTMTAQWFNEDDVLRLRGQRPGAFTFNQRRHPNDELFNVFGTALTNMCSKPHRARRRGGRRPILRERGRQHQENFTIDVRDLAEMPARRR
ncbi:MAG: hypothetical protein ACLSVD_03345 [Eggerthellaceae bacterium]